MERNRQVARFMDERQRGVALLAAGSQAAYEDVLQAFKQGMGLKYGKN